MLHKRLISTFLVPFFFSFFLVSIANADVQNLTGIVRVNNIPISGVTVEIWGLDYDGTYQFFTSGVTTNLGYSILIECSWDCGTNPFDYKTWMNQNPSRVYIKCTVPTYLQCPNEPSQTMFLPYTAYVYNNYNFNFTTPSPISGTGTVHGTVTVNGSPAPYKTFVKFYNPAGVSPGWSQTTNNTGNYSFSPNISTFGNCRLEVTVYTNPVTVQNFYFCLNETNEVFNPNLTITGYTQGYATGKVKYNCSAIANQIVYFKPKVDNGMAQGYVQTNSSGVFTSYNLPANLYEFRTTYGGVTKYLDVNITSGVFADRNFSFGSVYCDEDVEVDKIVSSDFNEIPLDFTLYQNYPNPFNPSTTIKYYLVNNTQVKIKILDINGQEIKSLVDEFQSEGFNEVVWDARNNSGEEVSSGIYFYQLITDSKIINNKMLLMR